MSPEHENTHSGLASPFMQPIQKQQAPAPPPQQQRAEAVQLLQQEISNSNDILIKARRPSLS